MKRNNAIRLCVRVGTRVLLVTALLLCSVGAVSAQRARWARLAEYQQGPDTMIMELDTRTVRRIDASTYEVWTRTTLSESLSVRKGNASPWVRRVVERSQWDCQGHRTKTVQMTLYDSSGNGRPPRENPYDWFNEAKDWKSVEPESREEAVLEEVCRLARRYAPR